MGLLITGVLIGWLAEWIFYTFWVKKDTDNNSVVASSGCSAQEAELITKANEIASLKVALENAQSQNITPASKNTATKETKAEVQSIAAVSSTTKASASKKETPKQTSSDKKTKSKTAKNNSSKSTDSSTKNQTTTKKESVAKTTKKPSSAESPASKTVSTKKSAKKAKGDDLTKIEGVGPKAAGALTNAGLATFSDVSKASVEEIQKVLDEAEGRFGMMKPGTWPKQAQLASDEKWDELKKWQDEMNGGIE